MKGEREKKCKLEKGKPKVSEQHPDDGDQRLLSARSYLRRYLFFGDLNCRLAKGRKKENKH